MNATTGKFNEVLATVEKLTVEDQATLVELVNKRIAAARRLEMVREIAAARDQHRRGQGEARVRRRRHARASGQMKLVWSSKFTRAVKKLARRKPDLLDDLETTLKQLKSDPYHSSVRTHKLSGDFDACSTCSAGYDFRIVFDACSSADKSRDGDSSPQCRHARRGLLSAVFLLPLTPSSCNFPAP